MKNKTIFGKWGVFIVGVLSAIAVALEPMVTNVEANTQTYVLAGLIAVLSFLAKEWRGKGMTIFGLVGAAAYAAVIQLQTGQPIGWGQFALIIFIKTIFAVIPQPKPDTYEHNEAIVEAKAKPPIDQVPDADQFSK